MSFDLALADPEKYLNAGRSGDILWGSERPCDQPNGNRTSDAVPHGHAYAKEPKSWTTTNGFLCLQCVFP